MLQVLIQLLARDAGLNRAIQIVDIHRQHLIHLAHVDADAPMNRQHMAF
jgi:hypothetical protein